VKLRPAGIEDIFLLYRWANDPVVRKNSFNPNYIKIGDHINWFTLKLKDDDVRIYIAHEDGNDIGQIRFDVEDGVAVIDVHVREGMRGKGYGPRIIKKGVKRFFDDYGKIEVSAVIKDDNIRSQRAFAKAGFRE